MATKDSQEESLKKQLEEAARRADLAVTDPRFADYMDAQDPLRHLRDQFLFPKMATLDGVDKNLTAHHEDAIYLCGNSLGLQPAATKALIERELEKWAAMGVQGHKSGQLPWQVCDLATVQGHADIVGARRSEITVMNSLTVNLHLLMATFYRPTKHRYKILMENKPFPSDCYAAQSQARFHGYDPDDAVIVMKLNQNEYCLKTEDIISYLMEHGESIAVVLFSGVQYYTGQLFNIPAITACAKSKGCIAGWDLAHAAGNVPLELHDWGVDFAVWCSYKYLNSGCGGLGVVFVHEENMKTYRPALWGWWGHRGDTRMDMTNVMDFEEGCSAYRVSHPPVLLTCPMLASLEIFKQTSMAKLRLKSILLTGYLEYLIDFYFGMDSPQRTSSFYCTIVTPRDPQQRGCQLSLKFSIDLRSVGEMLRCHGVVCDIRLPDVLRITPVHLYNSFADVRRFIDVLRTLQRNRRTSSVYELGCGV